MTYLYIYIYFAGRQRGGEREGERERGREREGEREREREGVIRRRRNESGGSGEFNEAETGKAVEPEPGLREVVS